MAAWVATYNSLCSRCNKRYSDPTRPVDGWVNIQRCTTCGPVSVRDTLRSAYTLDPRTAQGREDAEARRVAAAKLRLARRPLDPEVLAAAYAAPAQYLPVGRKRS